MMKKTRLIMAAVVALSMVLLLSACSGVIGGETGVRIVVPGLADGSRHVSTTSVEGYVLVLKKDKVYSLNSYSSEAYEYLKNGQVYIANLPAGDYIFGVALLDAADNNVGLAIKEITIEPGFNEVDIEVGPGIDDFSIPGLGEIDPFEPDGFSVSFAEDTIILDYGRSGVVDVTFDVSFGDATADDIIDAYETGSTTDINIPVPDVYTVPDGVAGIDFEINGGYSYTLILK